MIFERTVIFQKGEMVVMNASIDLFRKSFVDVKLSRSKSISLSKRALTTVAYVWDVKYAASINAI